MKKWIALLGGLLVAGAVMVLVLAPEWRARALGWVRNESFHRGMPMHYWLDAMQDTSNGNLRYEAILAVERDPQAIPALTKRLQDEVPLLRQMAAIALGRFGPEARSAAPALTEMLDDPDPSCRRVAAENLKRIDPSALPEGDSKDVR